MSNLPRARRFQFTLNEFEKYPTLVDAIKSRVNYKAMISCKETAPTTGHVHVHIYALFNQPVRWRQVCGEHVEVCRGSHKQNIAYICKNGDIIEKCNLEEVRDTKITAAELMKMSSEEVKQLGPYHFKLWTNIRLFDQSMTRDQIYKPGIVVHYIWGESGSGKTKKVFDMIGEGRFDRVKHVGSFWLGVSTDPNVKVAWYDDFRDSDMKPAEFINFIDYYVNDMNVKGGHVPNHYQVIYITSVQPPEELYKNMTLEEPRKQWMRRLNVIHVEDEDKTVEECLAWK